MKSIFRFIQSLLWKAGMIFILNFHPGDVYGQIRIPNPSFEVKDPAGNVPPGWSMCPGTASSGIYMSGSGNPSLRAKEGNHYFSLLPSISGNNVAVYVHLSRPVWKDSCQTFSLDLAYIPDVPNHQSPAKLRIYLGSEACGKDQLIFESPFIKHTEWQNYTVNFTPKKAFSYLLFEAGVPEGMAPANSNIHIDNLSLLRQCPPKSSGSFRLNY